MSDRMMKSAKYTLSIAFCMHDSCVTIADDQRVLLHLEGERFFKTKHIRVETPEKMDELVAGALDYLHLTIDDISEVLLAGFCNRYSLPNAKILGRTFTPIITGHHDNHIGTAFPSGFDDAVIVCADGGSDEGPGTPTITTRIYLKKGGQITLLEDLNDSSMNGRFYGTAAQMIIHPDYETAHNTGVGKLMGLSSMGRFDGEIWELIERHERLFNDSYVTGCQSMLDLFGLSKNYDKPWEDERKRNFAWCAHEFWVERFFQHLKKYTHLSRNIAMTGGCALNITLNSKLIESGLYENVYVSPISSDCGQSLGAVLFRYPGIICEYPYLGREFNPYGPDDSKIDCDIPQLVTDLMNGKIVAWYQGRSEIGPRALGHRSFLGLPNSTEMRDKLSIKVKRREPYRPVAAIVLDEDEHEFFESKGDSRYMTFVAKAKENTKKLAPAIVHYDGTTRLQTLGEADNPLLYRCLKELKKQTGVPIIMNSSFNVAGYPIVDTPEDAMINFKESEADILYLNGLRIENPHHLSTGIPTRESQNGAINGSPESFKTPNQLLDQNQRLQQELVRALTRVSTPSAQKYGEKTYSLMMNIETARLLQGQADQRAIWDLVMDGQPWRALLLQPPAELCFSIPTNVHGIFMAEIALHPDVWEKPESGACEFQVQIDRRVALAMAIDPTRITGDRRWHRIQIDVPASPNGGHQISLRTQSPDSKNDFRWALWHNPVFSWNATLENEPAWANGTSNHLSP